MGFLTVLSVFFPLQTITSFTHCFFGVTRFFVTYCVRPRSLHKSVPSSLITLFTQLWFSDWPQGSFNLVHLLISLPASPGFLDFSSAVFQDATDCSFTFFKSSCSFVFLAYSQTGTENIQRGGILKHTVIMTIQKIMTQWFPILQSLIRYKLDLFEIFKC